MDNSFFPPITNTEENEFTSILQSIGFADLIEKEIQKRNGIDNQDFHSEEENQKTALNMDQIRCICDDESASNQSNLIQCQSCGCFLHEACMRKIQYNTENLLCPFCRLVKNGVDQFSELKDFIKVVESEIKSILDTTIKANEIEEEYHKALSNKTLSITKHSIQNQLQEKIKEIYAQNEAFLNKTTNCLDNGTTTEETEQSETETNTENTENTENQDQTDASEPSS